MPRSPRRHLRGDYHHVVNRANLRARLFETPGDYQAFVRLMAAATEKFNIGLLGYCVMPTHWHLLLAPPAQPDMSRALHWLTSLHAHAWARDRGRMGLGHVYQGRFHAVPVEPGLGLWRVLRYVERNALAAGLAPRAEEWPWGSAHQRRIGGQLPTLLPQPFLPPDEWLAHLNAPTADPEIQEAVRRQLPIGTDEWVRRRCEELGISGRRRPGRRGVRVQL